MIRDLFVIAVSGGGNLLIACAGQDLFCNLLYDGIIAKTTDIFVDLLGNGGRKYTGICSWLCNQLFFVKLLNDL